MLNNRQVQSYHQGETNRPHPQQELSAHIYFPFQAPPGEPASYLNYQYQAQNQASASNNSFHHQLQSSAVHQAMDSPKLSYPENYASRLAFPSGDRYAQSNNSVSNTGTYPSERSASSTQPPTGQRARSSAG